MQSYTSGSFVIMHLNKGMFNSNLYTLMLIFPDDWVLLYQNFNTDPKMVTTSKASLDGEPEDNAVSYIVIRGN